MLVSITSGKKTPYCRVASNRATLCEEFNQRKEDGDAYELREDGAVHDVLIRLFDFGNHHRHAALVSVPIYFSFTFRSGAANDRGVYECDQRFRLFMREEIPSG